MNSYQDIINARRGSRYPKMARADRAKIFAPFSALRGLDDSLAAREPLRPPPGYPRRQGRAAGPAAPQPPPGRQRHRHLV